LLGPKQKLTTSAPHFLVSSTPIPTHFLFLLSSILLPPPPPQAFSSEFLSSPFSVFFRFEHNFGGVARRFCTSPPKPPLVLDRSNFALHLSLSGHSSICVHPQILPMYFFFFFPDIFFLVTTILGTFPSRIKLYFFLFCPFFLPLSGSFPNRSVFSVSVFVDFFSPPR